MAAVEATAADEAVAVDVPAAPGAKDAAKGGNDATEVGTLKDLYRFAEPVDYWMTLLGGVAATCGASVFPGFSIAFGELIDAFDPRNEVNFVELVESLSLFIGLISAGSFFTYWIQVTSLKITSERQARRIRREQLRAVLRQDVGWFDAQEATQLVTRMGDYAREMRDGMGSQVGLFVNFSLMFVLGVAVGFYFSWRLTLTIFGLVPCMAYIGAISMKFMTWTKSASAKAYAKAGGVAEEHLRAIRTVQTFGGEDRAADKYEAFATEAGEIGKRKGLLAGTGGGLSNFLMFLSFSVVFWVGGAFIAADRSSIMEDITAAGCPMPPPHDVANVCTPDFFTDLDADTAAICTTKCDDELLPCVLGGTSTGGTSECLTGGTANLVMFAVVFGGMMIGAAQPAMSAIAGGKTAAKAVTKIMERTPTVDAMSNDGITLPALQGDIVFKDIEFTYPTRPDAPVLKGLNLHCEAGKTTALCGASGCGKSTTIALLERFYDPNEGQVTIDGHDAKTLQLRWLRSQFGLVSQEPVVFADTIFNNIAFGHPDPASVTREQVVEAAKASNAHEFISSFPDGYDTFVGQGGSSISGGQKQRIAIARAIIRDPAVLLLDESTSALDNISEKVVQEALDKLLEAKRRTTIVIAHRLSTIRNADKIVVFDKGVIAEEGTHEELVAADGAYAALLRKQNGGAEESKAGASPTPSDDGAAAAAAAATAGAGADDDADGTDAAPAARAKSKSKDSAAEAAIAATTAAATDASSSIHSSKSDASAGDGDKGGAADDETPDPMEEFTVDASSKRLMQVGSANTAWVVMGVIGALANGMTMPLYAVVYADITEAFFNTSVDRLQEDTQWFSILFLIIGGATIGTFIAQFLGFEVAGERLVARVRSITFRRLMHLEMQFFDRKKNSAGAVGTRLSEEAASVRGLAGERLGVLAQNVVTLTAGLLVALLASWKLTLVVMGVLPVVALASSLELMTIGGDQNEQSAEKHELEAAGRIMSESIHGIRTVQAFGLENILADTYGERLVVPYKSAVRKSWFAGAGYGFSQCAQYGAFGLIFYVGGQWADDGDLNVNDLMRVMMGLLMSAMGAGQASALMPDVGKAAKAAKALFKIIDFKPAIDSEATDGAAPESTRGALSFRNVEFSYPTRASSPVLQGLSLDVEAGQTVALVGKSGCGKSTLMSLLLQFYRPQAGDITLDGQPLSSYNVKWLRSQCGVVSQEPTLIGEGGSTGSTIREAIAYGAKPGAVVLEEQIVAAAKAANAHDFITAFPNGYDTVIGAGGMALSGGQKQRVAIARAMLRDPAILLLDEATAALDSESERVVQAALDKLLATKGRTTLVIAHRLSTVMNADVIAVIDKGKVVESGTHAELLARDGAYAAQWRRGLGESTPAAALS